jgi:CRISPR-associated protein Csb2
MFALAFSFPAGRYHATPWGRNVNEADVAWPPEPWRILRTLIATWWRKGNRERWSEDDLSALIDALAGQLPLYKLPDNAVHTHTRHYMPAPVKATLVFDAFARLPASSELIVAWPELTLSEPLFDLAADLASGVGYLGRAESWAECEARAEWGDKPNCRPWGSNQVEGEPVTLIAARAPADYEAERNRLIAEFERRDCQTAIIKGKKAPSAKTLASARDKAFGPTLPERLVDALTLDTGDYQRAGWSRPPASREVVYVRQPLTPTLRSSRRVRQTSDDPARFTVARFVLAGRPRPPIEDAVKIGELMRLAALSRFGWLKDEKSGRRIPQAPPVISGRDANGQPLRDPRHGHAFWLPEDADGDGEIDHVVVYASDGFSQEVRRKLDGLTRLWVEPAQRGGVEGEDGPEDAKARKEWRLALEGFGISEDFRDVSRLLRRSPHWESVTPFLAAGHLKGGGYPVEIQRLISRRGLPQPTVEPLLRRRTLLTDEGREHDEVGVFIRGRLRQAVHFHRFRSRRGEEQPDALGTFVRLTFSKEIQGPLAFGYAGHFGLGLFRAA